MALTAQQLVDTRRYMGYSVTGNATAAPYRELAYSDVSYMGLSLDYRLANLSAEEENTLTTYYLTNLATRESDIQSAAVRLQADQAAVWYRNKDEIALRTGMFTALRLELCHFLGFPPGSGLMGRGRLVRG